MFWKGFLMKLAEVLLFLALKCLWKVADRNSDGKISKRDAWKFWGLVKKYFRG